MIRTNSHPLIFNIWVFLSKICNIFFNKIYFSIGIKVYITSYPSFLSRCPSNMHITIESWFTLEFANFVPVLFPFVMSIVVFPVRKPCNTYIEKASVFPILDYITITGGYVIDGFRSYILKGSIFTQFFICQIIFISVLTFFTIAIEIYCIL